MLRDRLLSFLPLAFITILGCIPLLWYDQGSIALGHDMGYTLSPAARVAERLYVWSDSLNLGSDGAVNIGSIPLYLPQAFLQIMGVSDQATQKILFIAWFMLPGFAIYYLLKTLNKHLSLQQQYIQPFYLVGIAFYMLNHYLLQAWFAANRQEFSLVIVTPIFIAFLLKILFEKTSIVFLALVAVLLISFFNGNGGVGIPIFAGLSLAILLFLLFFGFVHFFSKSLHINFKACFGFLAITAVAYIFLNSYWILPMISYATISYGYEVSLAGGVGGISTWVDEISKYATFSNLFRLQGFSGWYDIQNHPYSQTITSNPLFIIISFFWPSLFAFTILSLRRQSKKTVAILLFFMGLVLVSMILTSGSRSPVGFIYRVILSIPLLTAIRTPFYKFGYALWFAYAIVIAYGFVLFLQFVTDRFVKITAKKILPYILTLSMLGLIGIYSYPFFTGSFFTFDKPLTTMVSPSAHTTEFQRWIKSTEGDHRFLLYPSLVHAGADTYTWNYWSLTPFPNLLSERSILSNSVFLIGTRQKSPVDDIYHAIQTNDSKAFFTLADLLHVRYILFRKDVRAGLFDDQWFPESKVYEAKLQNFDLLKKIKEFGNWVVYEIPTQGRGRLVEGKSSVTVTGPYQSITDVIGFLDDQSALVDTEFSRDESKVRMELLTAYCQECSISTLPKDFPYPQISVLPNSPFYRLQRLKEQVHLTVTKDPQRKTSLLAGYAVRRIAEIEKLLDLSEKVSGRAEAHVLRSHLVRTLDELNREVTQLHEIRKKQIDFEPLNHPYLGYIESFVSLTSEKVEELAYRLGKDIQFEQRIQKLRETVQMVGAVNKSRFWRSTDSQELKYLVNNPTQQDYEVYVDIKHSSTEDIFDDTQLNSLQLEVVSDNAAKNIRRTVLRGNQMQNTVLPQGVNRLILNLPQYKNALETTDLDLLPYSEYTSIKTSAILAKEKYLLSYEYTKESPREALAEVFATLSSGHSQKVFAEHLTPRTDRIQKMVLHFPDDIKDVEIRFGFRDQKNMSFEMRISNIALHPLLNPTITFVNTKNTNFISPGIEYKKLNPTFYSVDLTQKKESQFIFLKQGFSPGWKVYQASLKQPSSSCDTFICGMLWEIQVILTGQELDKQNHLVGNGYGNVWYIPSQESDRLYLVYFPQMYYFVGMGVTGIAVFVSITALGYYFISFIKRRNVQN